MTISPFFRREKAAPAIDATMLAEINRKLDILVERTATASGTEYRPGEILQLMVDKLDAQEPKRKPRKTYAHEQKVQAVADYLRGATLSAAGDRVGASYQAVWYWIQDPIIMGAARRMNRKVVRNG